MAGIIDWVSKKMRRPDVEVSEEFGREFTERVEVVDNTAQHQWVDDGIYVSPTPITAGDNVTVKYTGMLAKAGADQLTLRMGYGHNEWDGINDIPMSKVEDGVFETNVEIPVEQCSRLHFCFVDSAGNWDNNSGRNWSYEIHCGEQAEFR